MFACIFYLLFSVLYIKTFVISMVLISAPKRTLQIVFSILSIYVVKCYAVCCDMLRYVAKHYATFVGRCVTL